MKDQLMEDELTGFQIRDSLGNMIGGIKDLIVDTTVEPWPVRELIVGTGAVEKKTVDFTEIAMINEEDRTMELHDGALLTEYRKDQINRERLPLEEIKDREVTCENNVELGDIYHFVIATGMPRWEVRKLLVKPKGEFLKGRRLRLDVLDVVDVKNTVKVRSSVREIQDRCAEVRHS
jgi:hypothetical protein